MADEPLSIRGVHWRDALPFTHLFRAFRVAIHPSKIVLALAALLLLYVGGHALDWLWPVADRAVPQEVSLYERFSGHAAAGQSFADVRRAQRDAVEAGYARRLLADQVVAAQADAAAAARTGEHLGELKAKILDRRRAAVDEAERGRATALPLATDAAGRASVEAQYRDLVRAAYAGASAEYRSARRIRNDGLFDTFFEYESNQLASLVQGVRQWNWFGSDRMELSPGEPFFTANAIPFNPLGMASAEPDASLAMPIAGPAGIVPSVERFFAVGPLWLMTQHPVYFALFATGFLFLWSIFGGAISRIAAVHVARDEKLSIRAALVFSVSKFLSFMCAPLIPLGILAVVGLGTAACALVGNIPGIGPIIMGAAFVLALVAGLVMAVVLVGLVGGFNLMYPTIAVEVSDSFDAISRSFSYLYARPWRLAFYSAVSVVYGSACYLFVRLFIYLVLALTHRSVALGLFTHADSTAPLLSAMWPDPATAGRLSYDVDTLGLTFPQEVAAGLIWFWVHLAIAVLGAFAVCFYFAANTIIYYLLRQEVDATDMTTVEPFNEDDDEDDEPDPADPPTDGTAAGSSTAAADAADAAPPT